MFITVYGWFAVVLVVSTHLAGMSSVSTKLLCTQYNHSYSEMVALLKRVHALQSISCSNVLIAEEKIEKTFVKSRITFGQCTNPYCCLDLFRVKKNNLPLKDQSMFTNPVKNKIFLEKIHQYCNTISVINDQATTIINRAEHQWGTIYTYAGVLELIRHKLDCFYFQLVELKKKDMTNINSANTVSQIIENLEDKVLPFARKVNHDIREFEYSFYEE